MAQLSTQQSLQSARAGLLQDMESVLLLFEKHKDKLVATGEVVCSDFCVTKGHLI